MEKIWKFIKEEDGLETVEHGIILGIIVVASIGLLIALGSWVQAQFRSAAPAGGP